MSLPLDPTRTSVPFAVALAIAFAAAATSRFAQAACAGSVTSPNSVAVTILCNNSGVTASGDLRVTNATTYVDARAAGSTTYAPGGNNILVQFDGHGRTLTVDAGAPLSDFRNVAGTRTAVTMGAGTVDAAAGTVFTATPVAGATTVAISGTPRWMLARGP